MQKKETRTTQGNRISIFTFTLNYAEHTETTRNKQKRTIEVSERSFCTYGLFSQTIFAAVQVESIDQCVEVIVTNKNQLKTIKKKECKWY